MNAPFIPPGTEGLPPRLFTNAEIRQMVQAGIFDEGERVELIRAVLTPMGSKASLPARARWLLSRIFFLALGPEFFVASNTSLFLSDEVEVQPDLHVFPARIPSADVLGPDVLLAIELSNTTQCRDLKVKMPLYAEHGVRELLALDLDAKTGIVFSPIENGEYAPGRSVGFEDVLTRSLTTGVSLRVADLF